MWTVKFVNNWNDSFDGTRTEITLGNPILLDVELDSESFTNDDFFLRKSRSCKLDFVITQELLDCYFFSSDTYPELDISLYYNFIGEQISREKWEELGSIS